MHPPLCVQGGAGSRGRSNASVPIYHHNQSATTLSHSEASSFFHDSAMVRWLQSAGLHHLATPLSAATLDHPMLHETSVQDCIQHFAQSLEKPKQCKIVPCNMSDLANSPGVSTLTKQSKMDDFLSSELQLDSSPGIFDIHAIDTELLSEEAAPGWLDSGSPYAPIIESVYEIESEVESCKSYSLSRLQSYTSETFSRPVTADKERGVKDNAPAKIKVVVRKRPINKKELVRGEEDIICVEENGSSLTVHEPKLKVDLTAYVERHEFVFDAILDQDVTNDEVYLETVEPIIPTLFERTKATCFAYGQTGSGKTYTMQPLPLKASEAILYLMQQPSHISHGYQLWLSFFEIYGGKLFDLLNDRRKLCMREDGRQQVCIVGLKEFQILDLDTLKDLIEKGSSSRSTGTTGANEESSRSHAILQLSIKKSSEMNDKKQRSQVVGKISFIDLAGSERGADTTDNDRQTRLEGAEINKSLLALKECIRALDSDQGHIPFRGSKLTEVLRDSFVGDSRTVMISCISPSSGSCEHTLNTLRYADRVKGLSRNGNSKKDLSCMLPSQPESSAFPCSQPYFERAEEHSNLEGVAETNRPSTASGQIPFRSRCIPEQHRTSGLRDALNLEASSDSLMSLMGNAGKNSEHWKNDKANVSQQLLWNGKRENKLDAYCTMASKEDTREERAVGLPKPNLSSCSYGKGDIKLDVYDSITSKEQARDEKDMGLPKPNLFSCSSTFFSHEKFESTDRMAALLKEEDSLVTAHCKQLEDTISFVREEMKLLTDVDQPGSQIDVYVSQLSKVLSKKAAGLVNLQAQLARFQKLLREQEIVALQPA